MERVEALRAGPFGAGRVRAAEFPDWPRNTPLPVATSVGAGVLEAGHVDVPLEAFVRVAANQARKRRDLSGDASSFSRPRPLLALPLFGSRGGGGGLKSGELLDRILDVGARTAADEEVDLALVLIDERAFALAQAIRKRNVAQYWPDLDGSDLFHEAQRLGELARTGRLVPFMGAGISVSAGAPTWKQLIHNLAASVGIVGDELAALLDPTRNVLDQAAYLRAVYLQSDGNIPDTFEKAVAEAVALERYGLAPALLANLGSEQAITLNYDELFEFAAKDADDPRTIIPLGDRSDSRKWLLKLHGTVRDPSTIVFTRDDYLGYSASRDALSAIVKATLITHHLMFVGFGLQDDHFHEIIHDVRRALPAGIVTTEGLATALMLRPDALNAKLWEEQLQLIPMSTRGTSNRDAARTLEIFLDAVLAFATDGRSYLLARGYASEQDDRSRALRETLLALATSVTDLARSSDSWPVVQRMLDELGYKPDEEFDRRTRESND